MDRQPFGHWPWPSLSVATSVNKQANFTDQNIEFTDTVPQSLSGFSLHHLDTKQTMRSSFGLHWTSNYLAKVFFCELWEDWVNDYTKVGVRMEKCHCCNCSVSFRNWDNEKIADRRSSSHTNSHINPHTHRHTHAHAHAHTHTHTHTHFGKRPLETPAVSVFSKWKTILQIMLHMCGYNTLSFLIAVFCMCKTHCICIILANCGSFVKHSICLQHFGNPKSMCCAVIMS